MNWYRLASTVAIIFILFTFAAAIFHPDVDFIFATMLLAPFCLAGWVFALLNQKEESKGDFSRGEWYENF